MLYLIIFAFAALFVRQIIFSLKYLHILQLEGYKLNQYFGWVKRNYIKTIIPDFLFTGIIGGISISMMNTIDLQAVFKGFLSIFIIFNIALCLFMRGRASKKKLVYTHRLVRVLITTAIFLLIENSIIVRSIILVNGYNSSSEIINLFYYLVSIGLFIPLNIFIANAINYPMENNIQNGYKKLAKEKITQHNNIKTIGITGSYGKTSTKHILNMLLTGKYHVLMTPSSFNTPMGLCKVVNEQLNNEHEIFIAEMGARYKGDIKELCDIVNPSIGIITSIGPQHLETMKSIDNIAKTKFELVDALSVDGLAVLNGDNEYCLKLKDTSKAKVILFGIENTDVDVSATEIYYTKQGTSFTLNDKHGNKINCTTKLLGLHNIYNILAATCVAVELGVTFDRIKAAIGLLEPVEHRLQIVPTNNGVTVIDDAFNSNPVGSKMALDVIKNFSGNKIIITPGMVELGKMEYMHNKEFGKNIAEVCNFAILVGKKRSKPIVDGLVEARFPQQRILVVNSLTEATSMLGKIVKPGDVVLFENDLPDNYNE